MVACVRSAARAFGGELLAVVAALRASDARLREVIEARDAQLAAVSTALESAGASSDSPYQKKPGDRSLRRAERAQAGAAAGRGIVSVAPGG